MMGGFMAGVHRVRMRSVSICNYRCTEITSCVGFLAVVEAESLYDSSPRSLSETLHVRVVVIYFF